MRYLAWKSDSSCNPIAGTDRILEGKSVRWILQHLAYEEKVEHNHNDVIVRCKDGTFWNVSSNSF